MSEQADKVPSVFISSPGYNAPQRVGSEKLQKVIEAAGYTPVLPMVSSEVPEKKEAEDCLGSLRESDLVVAWLDGLTSEGVSIYMVSHIQTKVEINFPPEAIELMQMGAVTQAKMGKGGKRRGIVLPHELNSPPPIPAGMVADYGQQGLALCGLLGSPMNFPDLSTVFEVVYAFAIGKPVIALSMVEPLIGMYLGWACDVYVDKFATLEVVLKAYRQDALDPSGGARRKALQALQAKYGHSPHEDVRRRLREREVAAQSEREDIDAPPVKPEETDATD